LFQAGSFQDCVAGARWDFLCTLEIYTNQAWMTSFGVIADRAFLFYQADPSSSSNRTSSLNFTRHDDSKEAETTATPRTRHLSGLWKRSLRNDPRFQKLAASEAPK